MKKQSYTLARHFWLSLLLTVLAPISVAVGQDDLLPPAEAFALSSRVDNGDTVVLRWEIADGYYMYRDKFAFSVQSPSSTTLGEAIFDKGKSKEDPLFGDVEIYEGATEIVLPVTASQSDLELQVIGQGCNEPIGVCYPPLKQTILLQIDTVVANNAGESEPPLPALALQSQASPLEADGAASSGGGLKIESLKSLDGLLGGGEDEFLSADDAFSLELSVNDAGFVVADFMAAEGYYLYRDQIRLRAANADLSDPEFPTGVDKADETYGDTVVYYNEFQVPVKIRSLAAGTDRIDLEARYQGCAEDAICYPPITKNFSIALPASLDVAALTLAGGSGGAGVVGAANTSFGGGGWFAGKSFFGLIIAAFGVGLALTFTPCVLPLIPILSGVIAGQGESVTRSRGGLLAIAYVMGTAVTYAAIGAVAGATGQQLQAYFQNIWAIGAIAVVFVVMSLSMFGLFHIELPGWMQSHLQRRTERLGGGVLGGTFVLGIVSALIVGACVSPLLIAALSVAIARGDPVLGASMMVSMALGMGVFLIVLGYGAGSIIPRAGAWMDRVKHGFGVMLLAVAIYLLQAIPAVPVLLLWALLLIVVAVYLGATQALPENASGYRYFAKGIGTVMLVWGVAAMIGGFAGERDILSPLPRFADRAPATEGGAPARSQSEKAKFIRVASLSEFDQELAKAKGMGRPVILDYYADWCLDCKRMEATTLSDPVVKSALDERFVLLQVDVTDANNPDTNALKKRFSVYGPPALLFFDTQGNEIAAERQYGFLDVDEFLDKLERS